MRYLRPPLLALGLPTALVMAWWFFTTTRDSFYWPSPPSVLRAFGDTWLTGRVATDVFPSLLRLLAGYCLALLLGISLGVAAGLSRSFRSLTEPVLEFFRAIPPPVLVPIVILFAGIGDGMKIAVIVAGCIWPILLNTIEGVRAVDEVMLDTAKAYQMRPLSRLLHLRLRGASPQIAAGARQALSIAILLMVISEMFTATNGLGFAIVQFQRSFAIPEMWSGMVLLGLLGIVLSLAFRIVESRVLSWHVGARSMQREKG